MSSTEVKERFIAIRGLSKCEVVGEVCKPIEGSFVTECEYCDKFC